MNTLHACPKHRGFRARLLSPKPIVTFDVQVRELARTSDCTGAETQFTSAEGRRFLSAGTEDPGLPNKLSAFFLACTSACLSQMLCSGACGWCPIVWQHRLRAVSVLQKGKLLFVAAERTRIPIGPCAAGPCHAGLWSPEHCLVGASWETITERPRAAEVLLGPIS